MNKCCAAAVKDGKGCCGKDAAALKADFNQRVTQEKTDMAVKAGMHKCCAAAAVNGKGCCGKDAAATKADFDKKVDKASKDMETGTSK